MSPNRKAELQRKLSLAPLPKPPAGLADRIKGEIPKKLYIDTDAERRRLSQQVSFNMRVAASILMLIGSAFLALHLLSRSYESEKQATPTMASAPATPPVRVADAKAVDTMTSAPSPPAPLPKLQIAEQRENKVRRQEAKEEETRNQSRDRDDRAALATGVPSQVADMAPRPAAVPAPAPPPPPPPAVQQPVVVAETSPEPERASTTSTPTAPTAAAKARAFPDLVKSANAADVTFTAPKVLYGIDVTSNVQHAAAPPSRPKRGLRLEADAAPSPVDDAKDIVRVSLDAPRHTGSPESTAAPVALDATLEIEFDRENVVSHRPLTGAMTASEKMIVEGSSATALFEVELKPALSRRARVATARLRYRATRDGEEKSIEQVLNAGDVARTWSAAALRTKRASLAAAWSEARANGAPTEEIEAKAKAIGLELKP